MDNILQDDGDGPYISQWNLPDPKPTEEDINIWQADVELQQQYKFAQNRLANKSIYDQLDVLDAKSIRALRTNDTSRLEDLEAQAAELRLQLLPTE